MTWRDLIQGALVYLGSEAYLTSIYEVNKESKKVQKNTHWKEKAPKFYKPTKTFIL